MDLNSIILSVSIPLLISIFGAIIAYQNYKLNKKKDAGADAEQEREKEARLVRMEADVAYIRQVVDGTKQKLEHITDKVNEVENRTIRLEQDVQNLKSKN